MKDIDYSPMDREAAAVKEWVDSGLVRIPVHWIVLLFSVLSELN